MGKFFITLLLLLALSVVVVGQDTAVAIQAQALGKCCQIAYYPSLHTIRYMVDLSPIKYPNLVQAITGGSFSVRKVGEQGALAQTSITFTQPKISNGILTLSDLADGNYEGVFNFTGFRGFIAGIPFKQMHFPWEGNTLGITDKIYAPFTPIRIKGNSAQVVLRDYRMNDFGLWDQVIIKSRNMLAQPMSLQLQMTAGAQKWEFSDAHWVQQTAQRAVYSAHAVTGALDVQTTSTLDFDGCMKVEMTLAPGKTPAEIQRLWLEINLPDKEVPLFHNCPFESLRRAYSGPTPRGGKIIWGARENAWVPPTYRVGAGPSDGVIWSSATVAPWEKITVYDFSPYLWLGGVERGLAWFAENDQGWIPAIGKPDQEILRSGDKVILRCYLINKPTTLTASRTLVFGLQASPTRPMPQNWRANPKIPSHSGAVICWGGYLCASKYPADYDWSVVNRLLQIRKNKVYSADDRTFFAAKDKTRTQQNYQPFNDTPWIKLMNVWADTMVNVAQDKAPFPIYFEEHASDITTPEWEVFQDEWRAKFPWRERTVVSSTTKLENNYAHGQQNFPASYRDFALYYANEWLRRGVGLYFDNTSIDAQYDPLTSAAYVTEEGSIQPAASIWAQREYYRRIWNLMNELTAKGTPYPLTFTQHMTNNYVLPFETWNTADLDNEWSWIDYSTKRNVPFPWQVLLTEMTGRQTGSIPHVLYPISGVSKERYEQSAPDIIRAEWGMRIVHEIYRQLYPYESFATPEPAATFEKFWWSFGYGQPDCQVYNYWDDQAWLTVNNADVKWIVLRRPAHKPFGVLVLQNFRKEETMVEVRPIYGKILCDVETGERFTRNTSSSFTITLPGNNGMRMYYLADTENDLAGMKPLGSR